MGSEKKTSATIILPSDPCRQERLRAKLKEHEERLSPGHHPLLKKYEDMQKTIIERLLRDGKIDVSKLCVEMVKIHGSDYFEMEDFVMACALVEDYCETGDASSYGLL